MTTADAGVQKQLLNISHLDEVFQVLRKYQYTETSYYQLGLSLGLSARTLGIIEAEHSGDVSRCLLEVLKKWLSQADNVKSKGGPSYYTLIAALRAIGENAVADGIDREKHPACVILANHQSDQSLQDSLPSLVLLLHKEGITKEILPATGGTEAILTAVQDAVCLNHENLEKFAAILQLFPTTVSVGEAIMKDYRKEFPDDSVKAVDEKGDGSLKIHVPRSMTPDFEGMRNKWTDMILDVYRVVSVSKKDLKLYFITRRPDLKPQLANCRTAQDILQLISERCSLIDVSLLEGVVTRFKIEKAQSLIGNYKESVKKFCETMPLHQCLEDKLSTAPILHCQKITFLVDRNLEDCTLKDIDDLVHLAFESKPEVEIVQVKTDNSFTFICSFPLALSESLIASALKNLEPLKEKGLLQLTIGYSTVYSTTHHESKEISDEDKETIAKKSIVSSSDLATAVYTSRGTLEQMVVSLSVQLSNNEFVKGEQLSEAKEEVVRLEVENKSLKEQLALFQTTITEHDTDTDILRQSVEEKEREIENLKLSLAKKEADNKEMNVQTEKPMESEKPEIEMVFRGTVFHCLGPEKVEVLNDAVVGVYKSGKIAFVGEGRDLEQLKGKFKFKDWNVRQLSSSQFLMPGFVDTHTHAPQYGLDSVTEDQDLEFWLKKCVFPQEKKFKDVSFATKYYSQVVRQTLTNGTTTASYYATIHLESTKELCKIIAKSGQRALVGKVNMDVHDHIAEENANKSIEDTVEFVKFVKEMNVPLIQAVITPRYLPSCSGKLLRRLAQIASDNSLRIQSILCEEKDEIPLSLNRHPGHNNCTEILDKAELLTEKTYMAHCIHLSDEELQLLKEKNVGIAHCPSSNLNFRSGVMDSHDILSRGIKIGLGTDMPSKSSSILHALRDAKRTSATRGTGHLTLDKAFYMATLGGAQVLNLDNDIGNFQEGKQFDALIVDQNTDKTSKALLAEFLHNGKEKNIIEVYVAGRAVKILL